MIGYRDYAHFVNAGPHCSGCGEIPPSCICSACEHCDEHALEPELVEAADGSLVHVKCLDNANEAAWEAEQERNLSEPPRTAEENYAAAWAQKLALNS